MKSILPCQSLFVFLLQGKQIYGLFLATPSPHIQVETETLVYPFSSLVAEVGGVLGLFLGVSFMTIWDGIEHLAVLGKKIKK